MKDSESKLQPNHDLAKRLNIAAWVVTILVLGLVGGMRQIRLDTTVDFSSLPGINALLNTVVAAFLLLALYYVKKGDVRAHRNCMFTSTRNLDGVFGIVRGLPYHDTRDGILSRRADGSHGLLLLSDYSCCISST